MNTASVTNNTSTFKPGWVADKLAGLGRKIPKSVNDFCDITTKASPKRIAYFSIMAACVLTSRYFMARNEDERREVLTRDTGMLFTLIYGVPLLRKLGGKLFSKYTGIPIAVKEKLNGWKERVNPEKGTQLACSGQLSDWLSIKGKDGKANFESIGGGFIGFCERMGNKLNGNLSKCFKELGGTELVEKLAELTDHKKPEKNEDFLGVLKKAEDVSKTDKNVEEHLNKLKDMFVGENKLLKKAQGLKAVTDLGCIALTSFILGGVLPRFNIWYTRKKYKGQHAPKVHNNSVQKDSAVHEKFKNFLFLDPSALNR